LALVPAAGATPAEMRPLDPADRFRHPSKARRHSELWNYLVRLDDGTVLSVCFLLSNIGLVSGSAEVSLNLSRQGAEPTYVPHELDPDDYFEQRAQGRFGIGAHVVEHGPGETRIRVRGARAQLDLRLRPWMPGFTVGDGRARFPGKPDWFHQVFVEVPRADASGTLVLDGIKRELSGAAYSDHVVQSVPATSFSTRWLTLRAFYPEHTVTLIGFELPDSLGGGARLLGMVTDRRRVLGASSDYVASPLGGQRHRDPRGYTVPTAFDLHMDLGPAGQLEGRFEADGLIVRNALLEHLSWLQRQVVRLFAGRPIIYRFRTSADLRLRLPDKPDLPLRGGGVYHEVAVVGR